jgi:hypothetical protein
MSRSQRFDGVCEERYPLTTVVSDAPYDHVSVQDPRHFVLAGRQRLARGKEVERNIHLNLSLGGGRKTKPRKAEQQKC